jgi:hypothetical protein
MPAGIIHWGMTDKLLNSCLKVMCLKLNMLIQKKLRAAS